LKHVLVSQSVTSYRHFGVRRQYRLVLPVRHHFHTASWRSPHP